MIPGGNFTLADNIENILVGTYAGSDATTATLTGNGIDNPITGHGRRKPYTAWAVTTASTAMAATRRSTVAQARISSMEVRVTTP